MMLLKKILLSLGIVFAGVTPSVAAKTSEPDFTYPRKVLADAYATLKATEGRDDAAPQRVRAVLEICTASQSIDPDSAFSLVGAVEQLAAAETVKPAKSLMRLIDAKLLYSLYMRQKWVYDRIDTPAEPLPADISEWSGVQFRAQIAGRAKAAMAMARDSDVPLAEYSEAVKADDRTLIYFPMLADFVAVDVAELLDEVDMPSAASEIRRERRDASSKGSASYYYWELQIFRESTLTPRYSERLLEYYEDHSRDEYARIILSAIDPPYAGDGNAAHAAFRRKLIEEIEISLERFPLYWDNNTLRNMLINLRRPGVDIACPSLVCPSVPFEINADASYAATAGAEVYAVTPKMLKSRNGIELAGLKALETFRFEAVDTLDSSKHTMTAVLDKPGMYAVVPTLNGKTGSKRGYGSYKLIVCTPYLPVAFTGTSEQVVVMADYAGGAPVEGVRVLAAKYSNGSPVPMATTDRLGVARFRLPGSGGYEVSAITPDGRRLDFAGRVDLRSPWVGQEHPQRQFNVALLPARPIYHPGDTLKWVMIADCSDDGLRSRSAAASLMASVVLNDANGQPVDTAEVVTDRYGRAFGSFVLPDDGALTGNYSLLAKISGDVEGRTYVMVSDYRMPTFEITDTDVLRDEPTTGEVTLKGRALTYSGMPVARAQVVAEIREALRWRWWQPARRLGRVLAETDEGGRFSLVVPAGMLEENDGHDFSASIVATTVAAETATADIPFTNGRPYLINITAGQFMNALTETILPVSVYDAKGNKADIELKWKLEEKGSSRVVASGRCRSLKPVADLDRVRGGYYRLVVEPADPALAETENSADYIAVYNVALNSMPAGLPLLVESRSITTNDAGRASFRYGVAANDTWLYAALCAGNEIVEVEVHKREKGFRHLSLDLPSGADRGKLVIFTVRDGRVFAYNIEVVRPEHRTLTITGDSFRDRLVPGSGERWRLHVAHDNGTPAAAAMAATMYNHSLDALQPMSWPSSFGLAVRWPQMSLSRLESHEIGESMEADVKWFKTQDLVTPKLRFLPEAGHAVLYDNVVVRGTSVTAAPRMMMKSAASANGAAMEESMELEEEAVVMDSDTGAGASESGADSSSAERFDYRESDVEEAFWMPQLTTDEAGNVDIDFVLPDANATWRMMALAWTSDMQAGKLVRDFVAAKPVMVQPNLPRFLREGDSARVLATVYNNSGEEREINSVVEVFDPVSMKTLFSSESTDLVAADGSTVVAIDIVAPYDATAIGYRVRSGNAAFSDGEQALIPVESAQCDVVESTAFYLNPGDKPFKLRVPSGRDVSYTLQYCQNPSWSIIKALPGLVEYESTSTPGAVNSLFAACTARGIVERTPQVAEAMKAWKGDDITSRLEQNDALKIAALRATPWVQAAQSDSERMARLSLLLDAGRIEDNVKASIGVLSSLACSDGGLKWGKWNEESSHWATMLALHDLGLLQMAGYLPRDSRLEAILNSALGYIDVKLKESSEGKVYPDMSYAVMRSMWKNVSPSLHGQRVLQATLQHCIKNWRSASTSEKANMAILLDIYGYGNVAKQILGSVDEFAVATPSQGISFPSVGSIGQYAPMLMAYGRISPASPLIDGMRQWLIVREQATSGLAAYDATQLVGAFVNSGTPWHTDNRPASVTLRGRRVDLGNACSYGGEATVALGSEAAGAMLEIAPMADVPSYGALISSYRSEPSDVKAASCEAISVEKRIMAVAADGTLSYADNVELGQRVRVLLTLHVSRDMEYVTVVDERAASLEPLDQTPGYVTSGGARFYRENRDASTRMFISYLPKGTYQLSYDCTAGLSGIFSAGLATVQSALAPALTAHSAGAVLEVQ